MPCGQKNQNIKNRSKVVTKSIKTLKMVHLKKKKKDENKPVRVWV